MTQTRKYKKNEIALKTKNMTSTHKFKNKISEICLVFHGRNH